MNFLNQLNHKLGGVLENKNKNGMNFKNTSEFIVKEKNV